MAGELTMPNTREKLIELLQDDDCPLLYVLGEDIGTLADYLIANGVTLQKKQRFLLKENGDLVPLNQTWIPVTERLPEVVDTYLVVVKCKYDWEDKYDIDVDVATYNPYEKAYIDDCWNTYNDWDEGQQYIHVTHWMPLPQPPEGE